MNKTVQEITEKIIARSQDTRASYLKLMRQSEDDEKAKNISAGNKAHAIAACPLEDKKKLIGGNWPNIAIVTAYNDMLSAHQPYEHYPQKLKEFARQFNATAQVAGGVPAMCDGVTQGQDGMELSLFSRDVIAMSTAIALSHNTFNAALYLGICDKIVPGLLMGALQFGHLPAVFVPSGPMPSGLPNAEKSRVRKAYARGEATRDELLEAEMQSYHSAGTCTFYGTANSNQMLMEVMGLHVPGAAFIPPDTPLRDKLTQEAVRLAVQTAKPLYETIDEKSIVNAMIGLLATGGSTNHTIHLPAIARAAGIIINWDDFDALSQNVPLLAKVYPNGEADINHFHAAGGIGFIIKTLLENEYLHADVQTVAGNGLAHYAQEPQLADDELTWQTSPSESADENILTSCANAFSKNGGMRAVSGNIGRGIVKTSAVDPKNYTIKAPALVFSNQDDVLGAYMNGELERDVVIVLKNQGPKANGMPELHKLTPALTTLLEKGYRVALITDGRMSGASGTVPAAIQVVPEAIEGGALSLIQNDDLIELNCLDGSLHVLEENFHQREFDKASSPTLQNQTLGRNLFSQFRKKAMNAEKGGSIFFDEGI
ncbi:MAG: phosphogluconate dehydratase [Parvibaculales bacterium]